MLAGFMMEFNFAALDPALTSIETGPGKRLDGVRDVGQDIDSLVNDSKGAYSKDGDKFEATG